jgi:hypothetical protein
MNRFTVSARAGLSERPCAGLVDLHAFLLPTPWIEQRPRTFPAASMVNAMRVAAADHRRKPGAPGHRRRALHRLQRHLGRKALGDADRHRRGGAASTFLIDGKQYVSVAVGWGGVFGISQRVTELQNPGTVYTFAIDGGAASGLCEVPRH